MVNGETDATSGFGDESALFQRVVNPVQGIVLHGQQETRRHLRHGCARVEQRRCGVGEITLAHQIVGLERLLDVGVVDSNGHAHQHVLRALCDFSVEFQEVRALEGLEPKVIVVVISLVVDVVVQNIGVGHDDFVDLCRDEGGVLVGFRVDVLAEIGDNVRETVLGGPVKVVDANAGGQSTVVGVMRSQRCRGFGCELVQFPSGHAVVEALDGQLGDVARVNPFCVEAFGEFEELFMDCVKPYIFSLAFPVDNLHGHD